MSQNLIINADDFGLSAVVNRAIVYCLENGIINSTSMMVNTPGFLEAVKLAHDNSYQNCIGVHINLTEGRPVTNFGHSQYLNKDGSWNKEAFSAKTLFLDKQIRRDLLKEINAQIVKVEEAGISPVHINSHHHVHTFPSLFFLFLEAAREHKYKLRIARTKSPNPVKWGYRKYIDYRLRKEQLNFSDYFETIESYNRRKNMLRNVCVEIMVHPTYNEDGVLIDALNTNNGGREYKEFYHRFKRASQKERS